MTDQKALSVLFIDNFDSFVFNLVDEFEKRGCAVDVWRNDIAASKALDLVMKLDPPRLVVLSPGPGTPSNAGCCIELVQQAPEALPFFGVCLGHQVIIEAFGGKVNQAPEIVHGKASQVTHDGQGVFHGLDSPLTVGRYHSLIGTEIPAELRVTAKLDKIAMAVEHTSRMLCSLQFHPESILTAKGGILIDNVIQWAARK
ncbi:MAG: aminodeoxychorismate/anthranilate synthase component II [Myxococcota bacterium]|nr:aminodeoxychorismate/anthranilate synthase component II [Myxococcota bacterium]